MRTFLTFTLFLSACVLWGQQSDLPFAQTPEHVIASAVEAWQSNGNIEAMPVFDSKKAQALISSERGNRSTITSVQQGIWSEEATWDCGCVPGANDNVIINHEVSFVDDAEFHSVLVNVFGTLIALEEVTLTFSEHLVSSEPVQLSKASLVANAIAGSQTVATSMEVANVSAVNRTHLSILGSLEVMGDVMADNATISVDPESELILSANEFGRATATRIHGGNIDGLVTRKITLPATPNRNMAYVEQRITTGLEGVQVIDFLGDIPTWGFNGADDPSGFSNIGYWSATELYNYKTIEDTSEVLPVWEGIYLALAPAESYTLTFTGTLPDGNIEMALSGEAVAALFGNPTNQNIDLQTIESQFGENHVGLDCWNINTLQYDHYIQGVSNNGLGVNLQPNTTCQILTNSDLTIVLSDEGTSSNGIVAESSAQLDGQFVFSAETSTGYRDEAVITVRENSEVSFLESEDARNTTSLYSACDLYLIDSDANRSGISQLSFNKESMTSWDLVLSANKPLDGTYSIRVDQANWGEGCAHIQLAGESESRPLEAGDLVVVELDAAQNHNYTIGTVFLVPPSRALVTSPGCEGVGHASIEVLPSGMGPWTIELSDENGTVINGIATGDGGVVMFDELSSGTYTYAVLHDGAFACGQPFGQHSVIAPTEYAIETTVAHDCGEGGTVEATAQSSLELEYAWSNGWSGETINDVAAGNYDLIVSDEFGCRDTIGVEVLEAPQLSMIASDGACDGSIVSAIELNSNDASAAWDMTVRNENGDIVDFAYGVGTPMFFDFLTTGNYSVETQILGEYGCPPEWREASIVQPVPMTLMASSTVQCNESSLGTASTALTGGVGIVSYAWSNGATGPVANDLVEGTYLVTATDAVGCEETTAVYVALSPQLDVTFNSPGCTGEGDTELHFASTNDVVWDVAVNHAENGIPFESLIFEGESTQLTGLPTGDYIVTYQDNVDDGCPSTSMTISMVEAYTMNVVTNLTEMECGQTHEGAIELMVTGGMGTVSAAWDHGVEGLNLSGLAGGQYYATVQDELGCTKDVRVELAESPTVVANFVAPTGGLTDGLGGMTLTFTNTSQGQFTGQTWYFGDTDIPSYDVHAMHTFEEPGSYDVFLNVWNDQCSHTVRKTVVVSQGFVQPIDDEIQFVQTRDFQDNMENFQAPMTTESGWILDLGDASAGMVLHAFDLTGRQLCKPAISDSNGQIWIQSGQWPALVLLRLVHEPTNSVRTWKMVR